MVSFSCVVYFRVLFRVVVVYALFRLPSFIVLSKICMCVSAVSYRAFLKFILQKYNNWNSVIIISCLSWNLWQCIWISRTVGAVTVIFFALVCTYMPSSSTCLISVCRHERVRDACAGGIDLKHGYELWLAMKLNAKTKDWKWIKQQSFNGKIYIYMPAMVCSSWDESFRNSEWCAESGWMGRRRHVGITWGSIQKTTWITLASCMVTMSHKCSLAYANEWENGAAVNGERCHKKMCW